MSKNATFITTKVYPTSYLNGKGFFYDEPTGSYVGDIRYVIDDRNSKLTSIDKGNYMLKNLFDYVNAAGESRTMVTKDPTTGLMITVPKPERNINSYFINNKTSTRFTPKIYNRGGAYKPRKSGKRARKNGKKARKTKKRIL